MILFLLLKSLLGHYTLKLLFIEVELLHYRRIAARIILLQIVQMCLAVGDHAQKAAAGGIIFSMLAEMPGQLIYPFCQKGDLNLGRAAIFLVDASFLDDLGLLSRC